jgi:lipoprotein-anchoring transpeptidase ErfK/SrfK
MVLPTLQTFEDPPRPSRLRWIVAASVLLVLVGLILWAAHRWGPEPRTVAPAPPSHDSVHTPTSPPTDTPQTVSEPDPNVQELLARAEELERADRLSEARELLLAFCQANPQTAGMAQIEAKAGDLAIQLAFNPYPMPEKQEVVVGPGDSLDRIARRFGTTAELTATNNRIANPHLIKQGDRLRVLSGEFKVIVNKTRNELTLTLNGRFFKRYPVGTGKFGRTPVGTFVIADRIAEPAWWRPDGKVIPYGDPENILGTRWLALKPTDNTPPVSGYGLHGTWDETTIGKAESAGCIRLRNQDIEELYLLLPIGTTVTIEE